MKTILKIEDSKNLRKQEVKLLKQGKKNNCGYIQIGRKMRSHLIWNLYNPNNKIKKGDGYCIHHKNKVITYDKIENLKKLLRSKHSRNHSINKIPSKATCMKMSISQKKRFYNTNGTMLGQKHSEKAKEKISIASTGRQHSQKTKNIIRIKLLGIPKSKEHKRKLSENHADVSGDKNPNVKVTKQQVIEIRRTYEQLNCSMKKISIMFDIKYPTVIQVLRMVLRKTL